MILNVKKPIELLHERHKRTLFDCGEPALNKYLKRFARQNSDNGIARAFVAVADDGSDCVLGYYTLSSSHVDFKEIPESYRKRIPRYPIPTIRVGRLAVEVSMHGHGLGGILLIDALNRILRVAEEVAVRAVMVDAKHQQAKTFYQYYGFMELQEMPLNLFLPMETVRELFSSMGGG